MESFDLPRFDMGCGSDAVGYCAARSWVRLPLLCAVGCSHGGAAGEDAVGWRRLRASSAWRLHSKGKRQVPWRCINGNGGVRGAPARGYRCRRQDLGWAAHRREGGGCCELEMMEIRLGLILGLYKGGYGVMGHWVLDLNWVWVKS